MGRELMGRENRMVSKGSVPVFAEVRIAEKRSRQIGETEEA